MTETPEQGRGQEAAPRPRSFATRLALAVFALAAFAAFVALGTWQLHRLQWKLALIERVEQRVHAAPSPAPGPARWPQVSAESDEYRRVRVAGTFLHELTALVQATTELGSGYWLLTPLRGTDGSVVLVNRGFIPAAAAAQVRDELRSAALNQSARDTSVVTGLLRISEPGGGFLRKNDPAADRWYSRDVHAIATARGLTDVAPYFVDAGAGGEPPTENEAAGLSVRPVGGLTVISFQNSHLVYALTWYALALMVAWAAWWVARGERRLLQKRQDAAPRSDRETEDVREN